MIYYYESCRQSSSYRYRFDSVLSTLSFHWEGTWSRDKCLSLPRQGCALAEPRWTIEQAMYWLTRFSNKHVCVSARAGEGSQQPRDVNNDQRASSWRGLHSYRRIREGEGEVGRRELEIIWWGWAGWIKRDALQILKCNINTLGKAWHLAILEEKCDSDSHFRKSVTTCHTFALLYISHGKLEVRINCHTFPKAWIRCPKVLISQFRIYRVRVWGGDREDEKIER